MNNVKVNMVKNNVQRIMSIFLVLALVVGCFAAMPLPSVSAVDTATTIGFPGDSNPLDLKTSQSPIYLNDVATDLLKAVYTGNSANLPPSWTKISANGEKAPIEVDGKIVGYFVFDKQGNAPKPYEDFLKIEIYDNVLDFDGTVQILIRWHCSKYYAYADISAPGTYYIPQLMQDNGKTQSFDQIWIDPSYTPPTGPVTGTFSVAKLVDVDGNLVAITEWLGEVAPTYRNEIIFELYSSDIHATRGVKIVSCNLDENDMITFYNVESGWYLLDEVLGSAGSIFKKPDALHFYFYAGADYVVGHSSEFDYASLYKPVNGYSFPGYRCLGYPGLNSEGDLFYIGVCNDDGVEYASFCANGGSKNFAGDNHLGCNGYMVPKSFGTLERESGASYAEFVSALSWIEDNYGSIRSIDHVGSTERVVTQTVIWALLGAVDVNDDPSAPWASVNLSSDEKEAVEAALAAAEAGYVGINKDDRIVDLVYLTCADPTHTFEYCQPQLVPVFAGEVSFINKLTTDPTGSLTITVDVKKQYDEVCFYDVYAQDFYDVYAQDFYDVYAQDFYDVYAQDFYDVYA
ncbi:MAG: hypothetical protein LBH79_03385, partial [Nitrososphaerota archaeon]|nr:hypothetical protein [Nitrososphaerota archaeon]